MSGTQLLAKAQIFHCVLSCPVGMWEFFPSCMVAKACWTFTSREWGGLECIKVNLCCLSLCRSQVMGLTTEELAFWNLMFRWPCIMINSYNKPTRCTNFSNLFLEKNSTCFRQYPCTSSGAFHCTHNSGICHTGLLTACEQDQDRTSSVLIPLASCMYSEKLLVMDRGTVQNM